MNRLQPHVFSARPRGIGFQPVPGHRRGATLVEVLMALLIMAIGVTSVFTLFPLAILKAIKAHQLTDAKLYESAIKDTLLTHPQLWTGAPEWSENTNYGRALVTDNVQDRWVTPKRTERLVPDTNQLFVCSANNPQVSGATQPNLIVRQDWNVALRVLGGGYLGGYQNFYNPPTTIAAPVWFTSTFDSGVTWFPYRHSPDLTDTTRSAYVVDPLGWHRLDSLSTDRYLFGRIINGDVTSATDTSTLDRIHCQISSDAANEFFRLGDSWSEVLERTPVVVSIPAAPPNRIDIQFPDIKPELIDANTMGAAHRVVLNTTVTPLATSVVNPRVITISASGSSNPTTDTLQIVGTLPASYTSAPYSVATPFAVDLASIEVQSPTRYSWLMAVHATAAGRFTGQCAVVLNRSFEAVDEQGYRAEFCATESAADDMWANGRVDTNVAKIRWLYNPDVDPPKIKEGGFIFDASHGYWYQIKKVEKVNGEEQQRVKSGDVLDPAGGYLRTIVTLNDAVKADSGPVFDDYQTFSAVNAANPQVDCQAVLLPGVMHVFSMTPESPQ